MAARYLQYLAIYWNETCSNNQFFAAKLGLEFYLILIQTSKIVKDFKNFGKVTKLHQIWSQWVLSNHKHHKIVADISRFIKSKKFAILGLFYLCFVFSIQLTNQYPI